jgi:hypothetical protein
MSKWQSQKEEREAQRRGEEIRESTSEAEDDVLVSIAFHSLCMVPTNF